MEYINKDISEKVLMVGVYAGPSAKGGMASVVHAYQKYFYKLNYIYSWKDSNKIIKLLVFVRAIILFLFQMLFNKDIKIVHIHATVGSSFKRKSVFVKLAHKLKKKIILHIHGGGFPDFYDLSTDSKQKSIINILNAANKIAVVSEYPWIKWFQEIGVIEDKLVVLNNTIEYPKFQFTKDSSSDIPLRFLYMGKLTEEKGVYDLLEVVSEHKEELENILIFKVGGFYQEDRFCSAIVDLELNNLVSFEGYVKGEKKIELLNWANVLLQPSYFEAISISILEGMSYGLAILATNVGGIPSIVKDGVNGLLFEPGNKIAIWESIKKLKSSPRLISELGNHGSNMVSEYYPNFTMNKLNSTYKDLLYEK